jgi:type II secretory pathway pseudopilin PulG
MKLKKNLKAQVWVETVVYTLIGLTIIAIILAMAMPQIDKMKDKAIIEQTVVALNNLDSKISDVSQTSGTSGVVNFKIGKGKLEINSTSNSIKYILEDTKLEGSEPGVEITQTPIILLTEKMASRFKISLTMNYKNLNITNKGGEVIKTLHAGATPYQILIKNKEVSTTTQNTTLEFSVI